MNKRISEYETWKEEMKKELDRLVAINFERIYGARGKGRLAVWGEIASALYDRYGLTEIKEDDPERDLKRKKEHCIYVNMRLYVEKEFPWELSNHRARRFVRRYGRLPKRAPEEWKTFDLKERQEGVRRQQHLDAVVDEYLSEAATNHPDYAYR